MVIAKTILIMMTSLIISILSALILIPVLKKLRAGQRLSEYLQREHKQKQGTPTMGGLIFIIPTVVVMILMCVYNKKISSSLIVVLITFLSYSFIGFIDDYLIIKRNNNNRR